MADAESGGADASPEKTWRDLTLFWGKARPSADRPSPTYYPLIFHSLDVAAVGWVLLRRWPGLASRLRSALKLELTAGIDLLVRLLVLHDLGKFARKFPGEISRALRSLVRADRPCFDRLRSCVRGVCAPPFGREPSTGSAVMAGPFAARCGGYGTSWGAPRSLQDIRRTVFTRHGFTAATIFAASIRELLPLPALTVHSKRASRASFSLAGFAVLCDCSDLRRLRRTMPLHVPA